MKKLAAASIVLTLTLWIFTVSAAEAGSPRWHRQKQRSGGNAVSISIGAAMFGSHLQRVPPDRAVMVARGRGGPGAYHRQGHRPHRSGHWEMRNRWVPPVYGRSWVPGHRNHRGFWNPGRWIAFESRPGYWQQVRVWISF